MKGNLVNPFKSKYPQYLSFSMTVLLLALTFFLSMIVALQSQNIKQGSEKLEQKLTEKNISQESEDTKNWKIHLGSGYSIKIPGNFIVVSEDLADVVFSNKGEKIISIKIETTKAKNVNEYAKGILFTKPTTINDYEAIEILNDIANIPFESYVLLNNKVAYWIVNEVVLGDNSKNEKYFDQILSTFRFLPDTSDWKTYRNEEYGFESKYHPDSTPTEIEGSNEVGQFTYLYLIRFGSGGDNPLKGLFGYFVAIKQHSIEDTKLEQVGHVTDSIDSEEKLTINGNEWTLLNYQLFVITQDIPVTTAHIRKNEVSYEITAGRSEITQILSTFKFTN